MNYWGYAPDSRDYKDYCAKCGQWVDGPIRCCKEYDGKVVTAKEAIKIRKRINERKES